VGDDLVLVLGTNNGTTAGAPFVVTGTVTALNFDNANGSGGNNISEAVYWHVSTTTSPVSITATNQPAAGPVLGMFIDFGPAFTSSTTLAGESQAIGTSTAPTCPSKVVVAASERVIGVYWQGSGTINTPAGTTKIGQVDLAGTDHLAVFTQTISGSGTMPAITWSLSASGHWMSCGATFKT
jgi:hypothetical protein